MSATHWENIYKTKDTTKVSWYEEKPELSLQLILQALKGKDKNKSSVIDVGGGSSKLSHFLIEQGIGHVVVLDISSTSLEIAKKILYIKIKLNGFLMIVQFINLKKKVLMFGMIGLYFIFYKKKKIEKHILNQLIVH
jgi:SAM-dependent methyltransferase